MPIIADARPCAHITPPRRIIAGYVGPASGLRTALLTGAATTGCVRRPLTGGAR